MKKMFVLQKVMFVIYILAMISVMLFALGFMTNYKAFQYLTGLDKNGNVVREFNKQLGDFHHNELIPYNDTIFYLAIGSIISILLIFIAKLNKKIPNVFGVVMGVVATIPTIIGAVISIATIPGLADTYSKMNFSQVEIETYTPYTPSTLAFDIGKVLFPIVLVLMIVFILVIVANFALNTLNKKKASAVNA